MNNLLIVLEMLIGPWQTSVKVIKNTNSPDHLLISGKQQTGLGVIGKSYQDIKIDPQSFQSLKNAVSSQSKQVRS